MGHRPIPSPRPISWKGWQDPRALSIFAGMDPGQVNGHQEGRGSGLNHGSAQGSAADPGDALPASFFELVRVSQVPVLVNFWAEWCGPCRTVSPTIERLARENSGRILTVKVNVDRRPQVAQAFEIQGVPTIMLFWKGEPRMRLTGAYPYEAILQNILQNWPRAAGVTPQPAPGT